MKVQVDGKTYRVSWSHGNDGVRFTACMIELHEEDGKLVLEKRLVAAADASCSPSDQFVKEVGRKLSLARALSKLFPSEFTYYNDAKLWDLPEVDFVANYRARRKFWGAYFNRKEGR